MSRYKQTLTESYLKVGSHKKEQEVAESQQSVLNKAPLKIYIG